MVYLFDKFTHIYLPFCCANYLFLFFQIINNEWELPYYYSGINPFVLFSGRVLFNSTLWYVVSVMIYYVISILTLTLVRWISHSDSDKVYVMVAMIIMVIYAAIYKRLSLTPGVTEIFPLSLLLGMLFEVYEKRIVAALCAPGKCLTSLYFFILFFIFHRTNMEYGLIFHSFPVGQFLAPTLFVCAINISIYNEAIQSRVFSILGDISFSIYIIHYLILSILRSNIIYIHNDYLYLIAYTIIVIPLAAICTKFITAIPKLSAKKHSQ